MLDIAFVFTIFMVTLGPIKAIPGFYAQAKDMEAADARHGHLPSRARSSLWQSHWYLP